MFLCSSLNGVSVLLGDRVGAVVKRSSLLPGGGRVLNQLLQTLNDLIGIAFRLNDCFSIIFVNFYCSTGSDTDPLSNLLWEDNPTP